MGGLPPAGTFAAVVLNPTATNTSGSGFVEAYPDGASMPDVSDLNYLPNQTIANTVIVQVGQGGPAGPIDLLADVSGYFTNGAGGAYVPLPPVRILDTRTGAPIAAGATADVDARRHRRLPVDSSPTGSAFEVNTTVTGPTGTGFVTDHPHGSALPNVSTVDYTPGLTAANLGFVGSADVGIAVYNGGSQAGTTQAIVDLFGYFGCTARRSAAIGAGDRTGRRRGRDHASRPRPPRHSPVRLRWRS
ncbi:MAG TPA: hypothetical protein VGX23_37545 [Actinocrinis sp.]|nr:hypothetical protein [Actinocrinis sp.]